MTFTFTQAQSSCIASVTVNGQEVQITYQSNPSKSYDFVTDNADSIVEFLQNPGDASIGQTYRMWVKEQILIPAEQLAAV